MIKGVNVSGITFRMYYIMKCLIFLKLLDVFHRVPYALGKGGSFKTFSTSMDIIICKYCLKWLNKNYKKNTQHFMSACTNKYSLHFI